jgi:hypothetical protein
LISGVTIGLLSIHKLVKPRKVTRSWYEDEIGIDQLLVIEAKTKMRAAHATVLWETNPAVGRESGGLDLADCGSDELAKLGALLFRNGSPKVLNLRLMLSHEDD